MERKLRIAQYGCGKMSVYTMIARLQGAVEVAQYLRNGDVVALEFTG